LYRCSEERAAARGDPECAAGELIGSAYDVEEKYIVVVAMIAAIIAELI
jgi:hypothetical protein